MAAVFGISLLVAPFFFFLEMRFIFPHFPPDESFLFVIGFCQRVSAPRGFALPPHIIVIITSIRSRVWRSERRSATFWRTTSSVPDRPNQSNTFSALTSRTAATQHFQGDLVLLQSRPPETNANKLTRRLARVVGGPGGRSASQGSSLLDLSFCLNGRVKSWTLLFLLTFIPCPSPQRLTLNPAPHIRPLLACGPGLRLAP